MKLVTERLSLQSITVEDWRCFAPVPRSRGDPLHLRSAQRSGDPHPVRGAAAGWDKHGEQWLCPVMREAQRRRWALPVFARSGCRIGRRKWDTGVCLPGRARGYGKVAAGGAGFCGERLRLSQADRHRDRGQPASRGLLESCGFQLEGTLRDNFRLAGQWYDDWLFGLLAAEFQGGK